MALSLITYFCTMVSALAILAVLLSSLISHHIMYGSRIRSRLPGRQQSRKPPMR